jgi:hypothetical protein
MSRKTKTAAVSSQTGQFFVNGTNFSFTNAICCASEFSARCRIARAYLRTSSAPSEGRAQ